MRSSEHVRVQRDGAILVITLDRADRLNALTRDMLHALGDAYRLAGEDPDVRAVLMQAEGRGFCTGADAEGLSDSAQSSVEEQLKIPMPLFTARQVGIYKPVICAIQGMCAGAGLHFVADSEIVIAATDATFIDSHVNVGQVTALEPIGLSRRMPLGAVLRMVVLGKGERVSAQRAYELGMVSEVVEPNQLRTRARELAEIAASVSPEALQLSLKAIWDSLEMPMSAAYAKGYEMLVRHRSHPDALEGPTAFLAKRAPNWGNPTAWVEPNAANGN
jgi:enoyl-CoA hydratase/carnithine racemase